MTHLGGRFTEVAPLNGDDRIRVVIQVANELLKAVEATDPAFETALRYVRALLRSR